MAYPDEIILSLTVRHNLSAIEQIKLREVLLVEETKTAVQSGQFDPTNLVLILVISEAPDYKKILSIEEVKQILTNPELLANPVAWLEWNRIKYYIEHLNQLKRSSVVERKKLAMEISKKLEVPNTSNYIRSHSSLLQEYFDISRVLFQHINARYEPIDIAAQEHFKKYYQQRSNTVTDISFSRKQAGVQLGRIMQLGYIDTNNMPHVIKYYIKTHQHGSLSDSQGRVATEIDLKELLVYKILEYIGYGPKVHFFFNPLSLGGFFIATQDASFTKVPGKEKNFAVFSDIIANYDSNPLDPQFDEVRQSLIAIDMISRILRIQDTTPNPSNYGLVTVDKIQQKWKLIDFRIDSEIPEEVELKRKDPTHVCHLYYYKSIYEGFLSGNGAFNYDGRHFFANIFTNPGNIKRKFIMAKTIIEIFNIGRSCQSRDGRKMPLLTAIDKAFVEIKTYAMANNDKLRLNLHNALFDLHRYVVSIKLNFQLLSKGVNHKYQELLTNK